MATAIELDIQRLGAKLFADNPEVIRPEVYIGMFHRWIQARDLDGVPIDVADYAHVPKGPGVMLIAHEADRSIDFADGQPGVIYQRKRDSTGSLADRIEQVVRAADDTASRIEADDAADGVRFARDRVELRFHDRLLVPNDDEGLSSVGPAVMEAFGRLAPDAVVTMNRHYDHPRGPLTITVTVG